MTIIGQPFTISWIEGSPGPLSQAHRLGTSNVSDQLIAVKGDQGENQQRDTLLHELLHACFNITGALPNEKVQEQAILALAPVLLDVLRSNSAVTTWLIE